MKLTKQSKAEVLKAYHTLWDANLHGDIKTFASFLDNKITLYGTAAGEIFTSKKDALKFYNATADQMSGKAEFRKRKIGIKAIGDTIAINEQCDLYVFADSSWLFYGHIRISAVFEQKRKTWKVVNWHASMPDNRTEEGEQINTDKIKAENIKLRDAVRRRTEELEEKNRELEIETSLERVRAVAMGMKKAEDMLSICKTISQQLTKLGVKEIRNVQTAIIYPHKGTYLNYEFYAKHNKLFTTEVLYINHSMSKAFVKKMLNGHNEFFKRSLIQKKTREWYAFQKTTNQFADKFLLKASSLNYYWYSLGPVALGISTYEPLSKEEQELFVRFRNVFELSYRRFLDIEKAAAQAKEAKIELGLERVRARAMAMQNSDELAELVAVLFKELTTLDFVLTSCIIWISDTQTLANTLWVTSAAMNKPAEPVRLKPFHHSFFHSIIHAWKEKDPKWIYTLRGKEKTSFEKTFFANEPGMPVALKKALSVPKKVVFSASFNNFGALEILGTEPLTEEKFEILHRFGKVFDASYTRFNDLKKAEAQAREAQIEAALERIRSVSMAIRKSNELLNIIHAVFDEWKKLGLELYECNINLLDRTKKEWTNWGTGIGEAELPRSFRFPWFDDPFVNQLYDDTCTGISHRTYFMKGKDKYRFLKTMFAKTDFKNAPEEYREALYSIPQLYLTHAFMAYGSMDIVGPESPQESRVEILKRFAKVFEQAYTRYLDVVKAEAQTREAKIETALEKVRSRTMAMHKSDELPETSHVLFEQLKELGEPVEQLTIGIINEENNVVEISATLLGDTLKKIYSHSIDEPYMMAKVYKAWEKQQKTLVIELRGDELNAYNQYRNELTNSKMFPTNLGKEHQRIVYAAFFSKGMLALGANETRPPESLQLLVKFASVFDLTYTRFLDLQKAEAQAREAQIELGLERVRARAMAMQNSDELKQLIGTVFSELTKLDLALTRCIIWVFEPATNAARWWMANSEEPSNPMSFYIKYHEHPAYLTFVKEWTRQNVKFVYDLKGEDKKTWDYILFNETDLKQLPDAVKDGMQAPERILLSASFNNFGGINVASLEQLSQEHFDILLRFAKVFDQTYTRFLDLQKAEAQAREAQIELGLERVRASAMAMHNADGLYETAEILYKELSKLGIESSSSGFGLVEEKANCVSFYGINPADGKIIRYANRVPIIKQSKPIQSFFSNWKKQVISHIIELNKKETLEHETYVAKCALASFKEYGFEAPFTIEAWLANSPKEVKLHFFNFQQGCIYIIRDKRLTDVQQEMVARFTKVFQLTYTRFNDRHNFFSDASCLIPIEYSLVYCKVNEMRLSLFHRVLKGKYE